MAESCDVAIVGGGVLGTSLAYWLGSLYEGRIVVLESDGDVARQTSGRNTGVIHRPFYLDPDKRKLFARSAQASFGMWKSYAQSRGLPWKETGTLEVATAPENFSIVEKYAKWAVQNGMDPSEIELLGPGEARKLEPRVRSSGAIWVRTDASVDFGGFTRALKRDAEANGARFLFNFEVGRVRREKDHLRLETPDGSRSVAAGRLINCAGGDSMDLLHFFGEGMEFTDLHFRGEYWEIRPERSDLAGRNIYSVPRHIELPFLDPHWIVRSDGRREIGPNAVLVAGSRTYEGFARSLGELAGKIWEAPRLNKLRLFLNRDFLRLAGEEWMSSLSSAAMVRRVRKFLPDLRAGDLLRRGTAGIRSSAVDREGRFVKEAIVRTAYRSFHVTNYNSPGATGAPAYSAHLLGLIRESGCLEGLKRRASPVNAFWDYGKVSEFVS